MGGAIPVADLYFDGLADRLPSAGLFKYAIRQELGAASEIHC